MVRHQRLEAVLEGAVVLGALATIPVIIAQEAGTRSTFVLAADWAIWWVFVIEYAVMLRLAEDRPAYVGRNWLSLGVIVVSFPLLPAVLALSRVARLTRLLRFVRLGLVMTRGWRALGQVLGRRGFLYMLGTCVLLVLAGAGVMFLVEPGNVKGYWDAAWWAVVTVTTVGYGDIAPISPLGRLVGIVLMLAGLGLVATLAASIAAYFVEQDEEADEARLNARLDRIQALLSELVSRGEKEPPARPGSTA